MGLEIRWIFSNGSLVSWNKKIPHPFLDEELTFTNTIWQRANLVNKYLLTIVQNPWETDYRPSQGFVVDMFS